MSEWDRANRPFDTSAKPEITKELVPNGSESDLGTRRAHLPCFVQSPCR